MQGKAKSTKTKVRGGRKEPEVGGRLWCESSLTLRALPARQHTKLLRQAGLDL